VTISMYRSVFRPAFSLNFWSVYSELLDRALFTPTREKIEPSILAECAAPNSQHVQSDAARWADGGPTGTRVLACALLAAWTAPVVSGCPSPDIPELKATPRERGRFPCAACSPLHINVGRKKGRVFHVSERPRHAKNLPAIRLLLLFSVRSSFFTSTTA